MSWTMSPYVRPLMPGSGADGTSPFVVTAFGVPVAMMASIIMPPW